MPYFITPTITLYCNNSTVQSTPSSNMEESYGSASYFGGVTVKSVVIKPKQSCPILSRHRQPYRVSSFSSESLSRSSSLVILLMWPLARAISL